MPSLPRARGSRYALDTLTAMYRNALFIDAWHFLLLANASAHTGVSYNVLTDLTVFAYKRRALPSGPPKLGMISPNVTALSSARAAASAMWLPKLHVPSNINPRYLRRGCTATRTVSTTNDSLGGDLPFS